VSGERLYPLEPLAAEDAVTLFVERTRAVGGAAAADETAAAICRRLDGLPLAIELAAARTRLLGGETLLRRLDRALPLLTGGARDAPERQQTLRATIEWSHDLLDGHASTLFERLAVFAGSFPLEAAEKVCDAELLETIREFALERLAASTTAPARRARARRRLPATRRAR
jgi:predicted ATPase